MGKTYKQILIDALTELPESLSGSAVIGSEMVLISPPFDRDSAVLACGQLASNINEVLLSLRGVSFVELVLRSGQLSPSLMTLALTSLEKLDIGTGDNTFAAVFPPSFVAGFAAPVYLDGSNIDSAVLVYDAREFAFVSSSGAHDFELSMNCDKLYDDNGVYQPQAFDVVVQFKDGSKFRKTYQVLVEAAPSS